MPFALGLLSFGPLKFSTCRICSLLIKTIARELIIPVTTSRASSCGATKMPVKKEGEALSTFEQRRLQNIADNNAILKGISKTAAKIAKPAPKPTPKPRSRRKTSPTVKKEYPKRERTVATRSSSRLNGGTPDSNGLKREADDSAPAALFSFEKPAKKIRVADDLNLGDILVEGRKFTKDAGAITGLISLPRKGAEPGVRTFDEDDVKQTTDKELRALREQMGNLELYNKWAVNGEFRKLLSSCLHGCY